MSDEYLESFVYNYNSSILGEYTLGFYVYDNYIHTHQGYGIKIINSLSDEARCLDGYMTYDEALEDVERIKNLVKGLEENLTSNLE